MIKILAIDDEPGICLLIQETFAPIGFTVLSAYNGKDAMEIVKKEHPKLIFLDIRMTGLTGLEVLRQIKAFDKSIKVVMLTVVNDTVTKTKALELGADQYITKPFMSDHLEEVARQEIAELLKERKIEEPRILVVDDEAEVCERMSELISRHFTCKVDTALNGRDALDKLKKVKTDLVVLDIRMPGLSGIDVIKEAAKFTPETKILAVSAYDSQDVANEALKYGAVDFIHKPQTAAGIERKVRDILKKIGKYSPKKI